MKIYRQEHPMPQFERENWLNLNGVWEFQIDNANSGTEKGFAQKEHLNNQIIIPFCPESELSGINNKDFMLAVWYKKHINIRKRKNERIILHFGAVDYKTVVFINGVIVGEHTGGFSSFSFDITEAAADGENIITVYALDDVRSGKQARGKQCDKFLSCGCDYTRTTGIWQTVWLEFVPHDYIKTVRYYPDIKNSRVHIEGTAIGKGTLSVDISFNGKSCGAEKIYSEGGNFRVSVQLSELHLWEPGKGDLYDVVFRYNDDTVKSYFGMREISVDGYKFLINGKSVFQRFVLDQGFYSDGIYTAPSEQSMIKDIEISMSLGFNGARLHQKVFEPRFLYNCDKMGYMVWGEYGSWGLDISDIGNLPEVINEWREIIERDFNSPSVIGWCPLNETWDYRGMRQDDRFIETLYRLTKALDPTRPCIDTSGFYHVATDIYDVHNYTQDTKKFSEYYEDFVKSGSFKDDFSNRQEYTEGLPLFISEYGGIKWVVNDDIKDAWGYGEAPKSEEEFIARYKALTETVLKNKNIMGFCYTQLYDIEQEVNGLCYYDRSYKFDPRLFFEINSQTAEIEKQSD